jgi:hypothetical protein
MTRKIRYANIDLFIGALDETTPSNAVACIQKQGLLAYLGGIEKPESGQIEVDIDVFAVDMAVLLFQDKTLYAQWEGVKPQGQE